MFDSTTINTAGSIRADINVTEKRAPTDQSVRLLREMETAAKAEVIKAIAVNDNQFSGVIHHMQDYLTGMHRLRFIYSVNGKKITTDYSAETVATPDKWIPGLIDAVARDLAAEILAKPLHAAMNKVGGLR